MSIIQKAECCYRNQAFRARSAPLRRRSLARLFSAVPQLQPLVPPKSSAFQPVLCSSATPFPACLFLLCGVRNRSDRSINVATGRRRCCLAARLHPALRGRQEMRGSRCGPANSPATSSARNPTHEHVRVPLGSQISGSLPLGVFSGRGWR